MKRALIALLLLFGGAALAQDNPDPKRSEKLVELAFKYRRDGQLPAADAAFDAAVKGFPEKSDERRAAIVDAYDVAWVESKWQRALRLASGDPLREGRALEKLGKRDDALAALGRAGADGVVARAELQFQAGRFAEAAKDYEASGDLLRAARAQERAGGSPDWKAALDEGRKRLDGLRDKAAAARRALDAATAPVPRDRARFAYGELQDQVARQYELVAFAHEKLGEAAKAKPLLGLAAQALSDARRAMTDVGRDRYGEARARQLGLEAREQDLRLRAR
jgi:hypothetical protein